MNLGIRWYWLQGQDGLLPHDTGSHAVPDPPPCRCSTSPGAWPLAPGRMTPFLATGLRSATILNGVLAQHSRRRPLGADFASRARHLVVIVLAGSLTLRDESMRPGRAGDSARSPLAPALTGRQRRRAVDRERLSRCSRITKRRGAGHFARRPDAPQTASPPPPNGCWSVAARNAPSWNWPARAMAAGRRALDRDTL